MLCRSCNRIKRLMHTPALCEDCWWRQQDVVYPSDERTLDFAQLVSWVTHGEQPVAREPRWQAGWR